MREFHDPFAYLPYCSVHGMGGFIDVGNGAPIGQAFHPYTLDDVFILAASEAFGAYLFDFSVRF